MPESSGFSLSSLVAVGASTALALVIAHLVLLKQDDAYRKEEKSSVKDRRKSRKQKKVTVVEESDDSSDDSFSDVPAPPSAHPAQRKKKHKVLDGVAKGETGMIASASDNDLLALASEYGFSMEDALTHAESARSAKLSRSPREVLELLQKGNARFWTGQATRPEVSAFQRRALIKQQFPTIAVLGCSDSRVPVEIVFDQGLGDMFVIRVAGNHLDTATHASLQYAINHLKVKVVVVLGHEGCGAVKASMLPKDKIGEEPAELRNLLSQVKENLNEDRINMIEDYKARDREAVVTNVKKQVEKLSLDTGIVNHVNHDELLIVGAFYEISSGIVDFFHEVSIDQLPPETTSEAADVPGSPTARMRLPSSGVMTRFDPKTHEVTPKSRDLRRNVTG
jgi:carbonic anhydrase